MSNRQREVGSTEKRRPLQILKKYPSLSILGFVFVIALAVGVTVWANSTSISLTGGDELVINCDGRGIQLERNSRRDVTVNCMPGNGGGGGGTNPTPVPTNEPPVEPTAVPTEPPVDPTPVPTEPPVDPTPDPTAEPTSPPPPPSGDPVEPYVGAPACDEIGLVHDDRAWHGIWDSEHGCHWDHEHKDDPSTADHLFGTDYYNWAGGEISYPWQTFAGANYLNPNAPAANSGLFENDGKHNVYGWRVDLGEEGCTSGDYALSPNCLENFRLQYHGSGNHLAAVTIFHSMFIEGHGQTLSNDCDNSSIDNPNRCYAAVGGWIDFGRLRMKGMAQNDPASRFFLPGENPLYDTKPVNLRPYRSHPITTIPTGAQTLHSWNSSGNYLVPEYDNTPNNRIYYGFGFHIDDGWGPFDPDNLSGNGFEHITCGTDANYMEDCEFNSSSVGIFRAYITFPDYFDGSVYDQDNKAGFVTIRGYASRYGEINTYQDANGNWVGNCTAPSLDCVPVVADNFPVDEAGYRGNIIQRVPEPGVRTSDMTEYDVYFCGDQVCAETDRDAVPSGWIEFPN